MKLLLKNSFFASHSRICIIGAGAGGINLSTHLLRNNISPTDIRIIQPSENHYYQPGFTMVGGDLVNPDVTIRKMSDIIPKSIHWTKSRVNKINPEKNWIQTQNKQQFTYDQLIVASGLQLNWDKVQGLTELIDNQDTNVCSIYDYKYAQKTSRLGNRMRGGKSIFTQPTLPIKCAGAPQKILYLLTDKWQKRKIPCQVQFVKAAGVIFGVPKYAQTLTQTAKSYGIQLTFKHNLTSVTNDTATFTNVQTGQKVNKKYDFLHVVPPMSAHTYIAQSGLGDAAGYVNVNKFTLQHNKYQNVWGLGDCNNAPKSKTAAATFSQCQVILKNMLKLMKNPNAQLTEKYQGYASCPLFVGRNKLMLAQFKYDGVVDETFFSDQQRPRYSFFLLKKYLFPFCYWNFVPRGLWNGRKGIKFI